jgi:hypothetical protein
MSSALATSLEQSSLPAPASDGKASKAQERFWADLPRNLTNNERLGCWVAYTAQGCLHVAKRHEDDQAVHRFCRGRGLSADEYFVGRVVPDQGVAEITDTWSPG